MPHYLLSVHVPRDQEHREPPPPEQMQAMMQGIIDLEAEMDANGAFVFGGRLSDPEAAAVVRTSAGDTVTTDGPFAETKEHIGGFYIIDAADLDAALAWAGKVTAAVGAPIEVRPFLATGRAEDQLGASPGA